MHSAQEDVNMLIYRFITNKFLAAKECDGLVLYFVDEYTADLFPRNVSARCKNGYCLE